MSGPETINGLRAMTPTTKPLLEAHVIKARREFAVDVRLRVGAGERIAIIGPSGAGKSTLLSCIAGLERPDAGEIRLDGEILFPPPMPLFRRALGYLTQSDLLFPHLSVADNVCFGLRGSEREAAADWIAELREQLDLEPLWRASAREISGGQARRVAMARMMARRPGLVLIDEPFAALDRVAADDLLEALARWQPRLGFALVAVDHRADILRRLCPRAAAIERGRMVQSGPWSELMGAPATPTLARLLGVPLIEPGSIRRQEQARVP